MKKLVNRSSIASGLLWFAFWLLSLIYWEILLQFAVFGKLSSTFGYAAGFSLGFAGLLALVSMLLPRKIRFWGMALLSLVLLFLYGSQMVYRFIFGTLYSVSQMGMGGNALTSFWKETLMTMWENIAWLLVLPVPFAALIGLRLLKKKWFDPSGWCGALCALLLAAAVHLLLLQCLTAAGTGYYTDYYYYTTGQIVTNQAASRFGLLTALRLEIFGSEVEAAPVQPVVEEPAVQPQATEPDVPEETQPPVEYNVLELDFDELNAMTEDEAILALNEYCAGLTGTNKNEYTGMLSDYNLIVICAESFSTAAIQKDVTPTLYKLASEGILFNNFYNSYPNTTTDGEYSMCLGLYPDSSRNKASSSMYASRNIYLPYALGNAFSEQRGVPGYGYHNYQGFYYGRDESHPNMGYSMKFAEDGMKFTYHWPASDLEMMEQSVADYISSDSQFHAYYMTFSGHYQYHRGTNMIANSNYDQVADLPYSEGSKCYLSCHIELDKALAYLLEQLEDAGVADKTAIVLAGDHFPYGLADYQYSELVGYEIDSFSKFKSSLIFWVGGLEENIVVDEYCCNVDILPTILNLWGFEYDSRMLAGTDVFSDGDHVAVLVDRSFLTDKVWLNTNTGEIVYLTDESELPPGYIDRMIQLVETKFSISASILQNGYYNFIYGLEAPTVDMKTW
ncbi:MAG: LTA synthase family protein [Oscillospiraceae bacterium]|nr:LTA synthase family protein [Oscillospiraceae bacterium]